MADVSVHDPDGFAQETLPAATYEIANAALEERRACEQHVEKAAQLAVDARSLPIRPSVARD